MLAHNYKPSNRAASILPNLKFGDVVWWLERDGTKTGVIREIDCDDGVLWGAVRYEALPGAFILENRHLFEFFAGAAPDFQVQLNQPVFFWRSPVWQCGMVAGLSIILDKWYAEIKFFNGISSDYALIPLKDVRTSEPELSEDVEYLTWLNDLMVS